MAKKRITTTLDGNDPNLTARTSAALPIVGEVGP